MSTSKLKKIKFSVERKAKNTRRTDVYFFILAAVFVVTFIITQVMLGVYSV